MKIETVVVGQMATNCYIVSDTGDSIIIDPGDAPEYISDVLTRLGVAPTLIVATHGHFDHLMAAFALQQMYDIPFAMHEADIFLLKNMQSSAKHFLNLAVVDPPPRVDRVLRALDRVGTLTVSEAPGHTPGSICLAGNGVIFTGDTIFARGAVGRTDASYGDALALAGSVSRILGYPPETRLLSGHGHETTVSEEVRIRKN